MSKYLAVLLTVWLAGCTSKGEKPAAEEAAAAPVQVALAKRESMKRVVTAEAVLYPIVEARIVPKISAPVKRFYAQRGDHVRQGQLLAVLETRDLQAAAQEGKQLYEQAAASFQNTQAGTMPEDLTKAKSDVAAAKQTLEAAKRVYESREALMKEGALAQKVVEDAKVAMVQAQSAYDTAQQHLNSLESVERPAQLRSSQAQLDAAKARYENTAAQSSYGEIRSPIRGTVSDRPLNLGEIAAAGSALMSVVDISRVTARANIPVAQASEIKVGSEATIKAQGTEFEGKVTVVSPAVDTNTTTVQVWVELANPEEKLKPGGTVTIAVSLGEIPDAIVAPLSALLSSDEGGDKVMIAGADGKAHEQKVEVGARDTEQAQILSGVKPGDQLIVSGGLGLDDKAKIEIAKAGAADDKDDKK